MNKRALVLAIGLGAFLLAEPASAGIVPPDAACKSKKVRGAGKKAHDLLRAFGRNMKKPNPVKLAQDVWKAESKFLKAFNVADNRGGCRIVDDADEIEAKVDLLVCRLVDSVMPATCGNNCAGVGEECDGTDVAACVTGLCVPVGEEGECTCQGCGDGIRDPATEECDEGEAVNGTAGSCCNSDCTVKASSTPCTDTDGNVCTTAGCNGVDGQCQQNHISAPHGTVCPDTDGNICTTAGCNGVGVCDQSQSLAPESTTCPDTDGNVCTTAGCNAAGTCDQNHIFTPASTSCDADGEECTVDQCDGAGACVLDFNVPDSNPCTDTDGDLCTTAGCDGLGTCDQNHIVVTCNPPIDPDCDSGETCNPGTGLCETNFTPASQPCPDTDGEPCTVAGCTGLGSCEQDHVVSPESTPCTDTDGDLCTTAGCNAAGTCDQNHGDVTCNPPGDPECDPIGQTCNPATGLCEDHFTADSTPCTDSDANVCTTAGCNAGACDQNHIFAPSSTLCDSGGGGFCGSEHCDGAGMCVNESDCCAGLNCTGNNCDLLSFETGIPPGTAGGVIRNFRCSSDSSSACVDDSDCDAGTCYLTPAFCSGNFAIACTDDSDCAGTCAEVVAGNLPLDLEKGGIYTGGGLNSVPLPFPVPDRGKSFTKVIACNSATGEMTLGPTTPEEVGERNCSKGRTCSNNPSQHCVLDADCGAGTCDDNCLFGPPLPIPNPTPGSEATSVCAVNVVDVDASGTAWCNGGDSDLSAPLRSVVYLNGDLFKSSTPPNIPGIQPCPLCDTLCYNAVGADNPAERIPCDVDQDCVDAGNVSNLTCGGSTECLGGPNDGSPCTPATSDSATLGDTQDAYPTSHDCQNDSLANITGAIGGLPIDFALTSATIELNAKDRKNGRRNFCGFCRDVLGQGSLCFEGNTSAGCPAAVPPADGNGVPCTSDADCGSDDEYESCVQRDPGAFSEAAATRITVSGAPPTGECLGDGAPHATELVTLFCIPPTFNALVDGAGDLPGPGSALMAGEAQLSPSGAFVNVTSGVLD